MLEFGRARGDVGYFDEEEQRENSGPDPHFRIKPALLRFDGSFAETKHHHHENKKHHDGARINDHFQRRKKGRAKRVKNDGHRK